MITFSGSDRHARVLLGEKIDETFDFHWKSNVSLVQADGDELYQACRILGRTPPPCNTFIFLGYEAQTLAVNWNNVRVAVRYQTVENTRPGALI